MTIKNIVDGILSAHPDIGDRRTCDVIIGADPEMECTGIAISIAPTVEVIRKAIGIRANFIFIHEPTFFSGYDDDCGWLEGNDVYEEKKALLEDNGIVVFRDHDHMHAHKPDGIFTYIMKQFGWDKYLVEMGTWRQVFRLPETTLGDLVRHIRSRTGLETIRFIGNPDAKVSTIGFCGHLFPNDDSNWSNNAQVTAAWPYDVIIPGEIVEWTLPLYISEAAALGKAKGMILPGHFVQEEAGVRWAGDWLIRPVTGDELPITFIPAGDMFSYM